MNLSVLLYRIKFNYLKVIAALYYRILFREIGRGSVIYRPMLLLNTERVIVGKKVLIRNGLRIEVLDRPDQRKAFIEIGDNTNIEQHCHIICQNKIVIGRNVTITGHCAIVDTTHPYGKSAEKVGQRISFNDDEVIIGDNVFVGFGSILLPGTSIGLNSYIGAMSVVKGKFPPNSLIYGSPAKLVKLID